MPNLKLRIPLSIAFVLILSQLLGCQTASQPASGETISQAQSTSANSDDDIIAKVAFVSNMDGFADVYTVSSDGANLLRLTNTQDVEHNPLWSTDGQQISYLVEIGQGEYALHIMHNDGSNDRQISTINDTEILSAEFSWSPSADYIVIDDTVINTSTGASSTMVGLCSCVMSWSPDGTLFAYIDQNEAEPYSHTGYKVNIADPNTGTVNTILEPEFGIDEIHWSPDGSKIMVRSAERIANDQPDSSVGTVYLLNTDGSSLLRLISIPGYPNSPSIGWSPDSQRIGIAGDLRTQRPAFSVLLDGTSSQGFGPSNSGVLFNSFDSVSPFWTYMFCSAEPLVNICDMTRTSVHDIYALPNVVNYPIDIFWAR